jgi:sugar diacid utilization regulator
MQVFTIEHAGPEEAAQTAPSSHLAPDTLSTDASASFYARLHTVLQQITTALTQPQPFDELLSLLTAVTMRTLEVELGVLLLADDATTTPPIRLHIHNCFPTGKSNGHEDTFTEKLAHLPVTLLSNAEMIVQVEESLLEQFRTAAARGLFPRLSPAEQEQLNPFKDIRYKTLFPIPLMVADNCLGVLCCYSQHSLHIGEEEQLMLYTIANHAALAMHHRQFLAFDALEQQQRIQNFIHDLLTVQPGRETALQQCAHLLGYDFTQPHLVVMMQLMPPQQREQSPAGYAPNNDIVTTVKTRIQEHYPGTLIDARSTSLMCLIPPGLAGVDQVNMWLHTLAQELHSKHSLRLSIGLSALCHAVSDYPRGYAQAREALEIGQRLHGHGSTHFDALGIYRYIYPFASSSASCDSYQEQIRRVARYDQHKKTKLLDTLETYLESGADITLTSKLLHVHRNTLVQRIERIQSLCTLDLKQHTHWLSLLAALKVYRLHEQGPEL